LPFNVKKSDKCPATKPWGVIGPGGKVHGCHTTKKSAREQQKALYANTEDAAAQAAVSMMAVVAKAGVRATVEDPAPVSQLPVLVTMKNQLLVEVGIDYPASTGKVTFTSEDLVSAKGANFDPTVPRPRVKLGHDDPRFNVTEVFDGEPAFGFIERSSMAVSDDGMRLYGDYTAVPKWLAGVMPVAYPSRSIEGWFNFTAPSGREYQFGLTAVALLGVMWPAVMNMADLPLMYGAEMPDFVTIQEAA
jgi:hypothetical protein